MLLTRENCRKYTQIELIMAGTAGGLVGQGMLSFWRSHSQQHGFKI